MNQRVRDTTYRNGNLLYIVGHGDTRLSIDSMALTQIKYAGIYVGLLRDSTNKRHQTG